MKKAFIVLAAIGTASAARADILTFTTILLGVNERPNPAASPGVGFGFLRIDTNTLAYSGSLRWRDLVAPATDSHIHAGGANDFGNVIYPIGVSGTTTESDGFVLKTFSGTLSNKNITLNGVPQGTFTPQQQIDEFFREGRTYFNVHSSTFPGGEIRGQLLQVVPEPTSVAAMALGLVALVRRRRR